VLPAASRAVTVSTFDPACRTIPLAVQLVVPLAVPLPPRLFTHLTCVTRTSSDAVPRSIRTDVHVRYVELVVGEVIAIVGGPPRPGSPSVYRSGCYRTRRGP